MSTKQGNREDPATIKFEKTILKEIEKRIENEFGPDLTSYRWNAYAGAPGHRYLEFFQGVLRVFVTFSTTDQKWYVVMQSPWRKLTADIVRLDVSNPALFEQAMASIKKFVVDFRNLVNFKNKESN